MIIALTGTPGTGKTTVAPHVVDALGYDLFDLNQFIHDNDISDDYDEDRESAMVDTDALNNAIQDDISDDTVIEGHLSHHLDCVDLVIVLRTDPEELETRLTEKDWNEEKIAENVDAERLDTILQEAVNLHPEQTYEVDTTTKDPDAIADKISYLVNNPSERDLFAPGSTQWDMDGMDTI